MRSLKSHVTLIKCIQRECTLVIEYKYSSRLFDRKHISHCEQKKIFKIAFFRNLCWLLCSLYSKLSNLITLNYFSKILGFCTYSC